MKTHKKIIGVLLLTGIILSTTIISIFAYDPIAGTTPNDLGEEITDLNNIPTGFYYIKIKIINVVEEDILTIKYTKLSDNTTTNLSRLYESKLNNIDYIRYNYISYNQPWAIASPIYYQNNLRDNLMGISTTRTFYLAFAIASRTGYTISIVPNNTNNYEVKLYYMGDTGIDYDYAYMQGYLSGYEDGFNSYEEAEENMNIVDQITMLISRFTGEEIAPYITPIAVVLTILMVYFLFIRFLLSMIKAKGVIKVCDIVMLVSSIIILVCMYLPFININITNHNINENVETTSQNVYQINEDTDYRSYVRVIENETGTLYISKYGDVFVPKETKEIETIYNIKEDIKTKAVQP